MSDEDLIASWTREEEHAFSGWDFSHLRGRMREEQPPWSYTDRAATLAAGAGSLLDMDTGGGERLLALRSSWPARVVATEHYSPNVVLARERLEPAGAEVVDADCTDGCRLPFAGGEFDLVLNRHGAFDPAEVARILAPGGTFLTQQVHGLFAADLVAAFGIQPPLQPHALDQHLPRLAAAGMTIVAADDWSGPLEFTGVAAVVFYLHAIPWMVPGFSVATHSQHLLELQQRIEKEGGLRFTARYFAIEAVR